MNQNLYYTKPSLVCFRLFKKCFKDEMFLHVLDNMESVLTSHFNKNDRLND